jgi:hypothetical protein
MSAAIDRIGATIDRAYARLKAIHWARKEREASLECVAAMGRGDRAGSRAAEAWAEVCSMRVQAWTEEAAK